jgi:hypothetical protein
MPTLELETMYCTSMAPGTTAAQSATGPQRRQLGVRVLSELRTRRQQVHATFLKYRLPTMRLQLSVLARPQIAHKISVVGTPVMPFFLF